MKSSLFTLLLAILVLSSCTTIESKKEEVQLNTGQWLFEMDLKKASLPFEAILKEENGVYNLTILNAEEKIYTEELSIRNDSLFIDLPVFESSFYLKINAQDQLSGVWINYYKSKDYKINVEARHTEDERFSNIQTKQGETSELHRKYRVSFSPGTEDEYPAIGLFKMNGQRVEGTFATETGDYRFLEGVSIGNKLYLSTFDGSHAFYFEASIKDSSLENGVFYSGIHFEEGWVGQKDDEFSLRDPDSLTFSNDSSAITFELENEKGIMVSLENERFDGKVKLIQIMGSWCPNCLDESLYFTELNKKYKEEGLEIIALAFERTKSKEQAIKNINRLRDQKGIDYTTLLGGHNRDQHPMDVFPMLNHIMSYPTTLYLDKENKIRKIHTGFYGPGTGDLYDEYKKETEAFIESLLSD